MPAGVQKFQIRDLQENHEYMIRIFAKNEIGLSEPLESEEPYKVMTAGMSTQLLFNIFHNANTFSMQVMPACPMSHARR